MTTNIRNLVLLALLPLFVVGCASSSAQKYRDRGAVIGGALGAAADGITGGIAGVIVGSAIGSYMTDDEEAVVAEQAATEPKAVETVAVAAEPEAVETDTVVQAEAPAEWVAGTVEQAVSASRYEEYVVVRGDNLWNISAKPEIYNNPYHWPLIYKANRDQIEDADLIYPDQSLRFAVSSDLAEEEMNSAAEHARSRGAWSIGTVEDGDLNYLNAQ